MFRLLTRYIMDNAKMVSRGYPQLKGKYSQIAAEKKKIKKKIIIIIK